MFARKVKKDITASPRRKALDVLLSEEGVWAKDMNARIAMTIACRDTDYIPKVNDAGQTKVVEGEKVQVMHNGLLVKSGGYHGDWMSHIIKTLKGHHEPQEEKVFYEIVKKLPNKPTMIELGSFWAYYSLWVNKEKNSALNICCEPDKTNMGIGKVNARINKAKNIKFYDVASGKTDGEVVDLVMDSDPSKTEKVTIRTVDSLMKENKLRKLDLLHLDIQGVELDALEGAIETIKQGKLRFLIVSTHHYFFSGDPLTHQKCIDFIRHNGGHIVASHTVLESSSGDGLIAASFDSKDKGFKIDVSVNHTDDSLFRSYERDLAILINYYDTQTVA